MNNDNTLLKEVLVDGETLIILWQDTLRLLKDCTINISCANFVDAKEFYTRHTQMIAENFPDKLDDFVRDTKKLRENILFNERVNAIFNKFLTTSNPYTNDMVANPGQNLTFRFFKGFKIQNDFDMAPWLEENVAYSFYRKENRDPITLFTCSDTLMDLLDLAQMDLPVISVDLNKLCD